MAELYLVRHGQASFGQPDTDALDAYLQTRLPGYRGPLTARKFKGGQSNPTFLLTTANGPLVLRRQPPGKLLKSAHAVDREFRVLTALADTPVPVAKAIHLCEDCEVIGSLFYLMSFEDGDIFWDPALPQLERTQRAAYYSELVRIMADLHAVNFAAVGLADYGKPGNYFERQTGMWTQQYRASETGHLPSMERLIQWLGAHCPADDGQVSLVHGDFRMDNIMFRKGQAKGQAVLDWELSTLGHPLADLAYFCMCLRLPAKSLIPGLAGQDRVALGIPSEADIVADYCKRRGLDRMDHWTFYLAFAFFRLAAIAQGVLKRALDGNAASEQAMAVGKMAVVLADMAMDIIDNQNSTTGRASA
jgi:aminoglycoside phosphotransferase (APT) family kinase protein